MAQFNRSLYYGLKNGTIKPIFGNTEQIQVLLTAEEEEKILENMKKTEIVKSAEICVKVSCPYCGNRGGGENEDDALDEISNSFFTIPHLKCCSCNKLFMK